MIKLGRLIKDYRYNGGKIFKYKSKDYGYIFQVYSHDGQYDQLFTKSEAEEFIDRCNLNHIKLQK